MLIFEYIVDIGCGKDHGAKRVYGLIPGEDEASALNTLGHYYNEDIIRMIYFGCATDINCPYELNAEYADEFRIEGRRFGKIVPPLVNYPVPENG